MNHREVIDWLNAIERFRATIGFELYGLMFQKFGVLPKPTGKEQAAAEDGVARILRMN